MATYHVNYLTGSNPFGNGTAANPWQTVLHTCQTGPIAPNDTIKVAGMPDTTVSTTATFVDGNTINTGVNLSADFAVGDLFIISPNITGHPEFNGWMIFEVLTITSTQITVNSTTGFAQLFPDFLTLTLDIIKLGGSPLITGTLNYEDLSAIPVANLNNVLIEGGYNSDFTTVTGYTNLFRSGLAVAASSGTVFEVDALWTAQIKNFRFSKFNQVGQSNSGGNAFYNNIVFNSCSNSIRTVTSKIGIEGVGSVNDFYLCNSGWDFFGQFQAENTNIHAYKTTRNYALSRSSINTTLGYVAKINVYATSNLSASFTTIPGNSIGASNGITYGRESVFGTIKYLVGNYVGRYPYILMPNNEPEKFSSITNVDDLQVITSSGNNSSWNLISNALAVYANTMLRLPNSFNIDSYKPQSKDLFIASGNTITLIKDDGTLCNIDPVTNQQILTDTVEYVTGNSSRKISALYKLPTGVTSYTNGLPLGTFKYNNGGQTLQSITLKMKKSANIESITFNLQFSSYFLTAPQSVLPTVTVNTDTFADYTLVLNPTVISQLELEPNANTLLYLTQTAIEFSSPFSVYYWIDSVTFNYA